MNIARQISCPVSTESVDENNARVAAFLIFIVTSVSLLLHDYYMVFIVSLDFAIRSFGNRKYSFIRYLSVRISALLQLPAKPIDAAPKKFAAAVGFVFSLLISAGLFFGWTYVSLITGSLLLFCAFLEFAFAYCVGCVVYTYLLRYGIIRN